MTKYEQILAEERHFIRRFGHGSEPHRMARYLLRREAWTVVQREHTSELAAIAGALFGALVGWAE